MKCTECKSSELRRATRQDMLLVGDREFEGTIEGVECVQCGTFFEDGPSGIAFEEKVATWLAEHGFSTGEEIRFMRKAAGLRAVDLASLLGVSAETVSHWETEQHRPVRGTIVATGALVLDSIHGTARARTGERLSVDVTGKGL